MSITDDSNSLPISGPEWDIPIPEDLVSLYGEAISNEAAICHFEEHGPRNSRWLNLQETPRNIHTLKALIGRIAQLEHIIRKRS